MTALAFQACRGSSLWNCWCMTCLGFSRAYRRSAMFGTWPGNFWRSWCRAYRGSSLFKLGLDNVKSLGFRAYRGSSLFKLGLDNVKSLGFRAYRGSSLFKLGLDNVCAERFRHGQDVVLDLLKPSIDGRHSQGDDVGAALQCNGICKGYYNVMAFVRVWSSRKVTIGAALHKQNPRKSTKGARE